MIVSGLDNILSVHIFQPKARWFLLHSIVNAIVVCLSFYPTYLLMTVPLHEGIIELERPGYEPGWESNRCTSLLVFTLHVYHMVMFKFNRMDITHHVVMMGLLSIPLYLGQPLHMLLTNLCLFFTCGLPGGIDYYLIYLVESDQLPKIKEKQINVWLNTWLRAPGIMFGAFICYQHWLAVNEDPVIHLATCLVLIWNAQYFSSLTSISYGMALKGHSFKSEIN